MRSLVSRWNKLVSRRRERRADYLHGDIRELRNKLLDIPAWIEETRGLGHVTASELEYDAAQRGEIWTTTTYNPAYRNLEGSLKWREDELERLGLKLSLAARIS
jgi:hypothetical protein